MKKIFLSLLVLASMFFISCKKDKCECVYSGYINKTVILDKPGGDYKECDFYNELISGKIIAPNGIDSVNVATKILCDEK